jgi:hypothetical protein
LRLFHIHSTLRSCFCFISCVVVARSYVIQEAADKNNLFLYAFIQNCPPMSFFEAFLASLHIPAKIKVTVHLDYCRIFFSTHGEIKFWHAW